MRRKLRGGRELPLGRERRLQVPERRAVDELRPRRRALPRPARAPQAAAPLAASEIDCGGARPVTIGRQARNRVRVERVLGVDTVRRVGELARGLAARRRPRRRSGRPGSRPSRGSGVRRDSADCAAASCFTAARLDGPLQSANASRAAPRASGSGGRSQPPARPVDPCRAASPPARAPAPRSSRPGRTRAAAAAARTAAFVTAPGTVVLSPRVWKTVTPTDGARGNRGRARNDERRHGACGRRPEGMRRSPRPRA